MKSDKRTFLGEYSNYLLPSLSLLLSPLISVLDGHSRFFEHIPASLICFLAFALILAAILSSIQVFLKAEKLRIIVSRGAYFIFIMSFVLYSSTHIESIRANIPHFFRLALVFGVILCGVLFRYMKFENLQKILSVVCFSFLIADLNTFRQIEYNLSAKASAETIKKNKNPSHVFHFVFDLFSYELASLDNSKFFDEVNSLSKKFNLNFYSNFYANEATTLPSISSILQYDKSKPFNFVSTKKQDAKNSLFKYFSDKGNRVSLHGMAYPYCSLFSKWTHTCKMKDSTFYAELYQITALYIASIFPRLMEFIFRQTAFDIIYPNNLMSLKMVDLFIKDHPKEIFENNSTYSYFHVVLPHYPHKLDENCNYHPDWPDFDSFHFKGIHLKNYQKMTSCALKLIDRLLSHLQSINILSNSRLIIHSDHGRYSPS